MRSSTAKVLVGVVFLVSLLSQFEFVVGLSRFVPGNRPKTTLLDTTSSDSANYLEPDEGSKFFLRNEKGKLFDVPAIVGWKPEVVPEIGGYDENVAGHVANNMALGGNGLQLAYLTDLKEKLINKFKNQKGSSPASINWLESNWKLITATSDSESLLAFYRFLDKWDQHAAKTKKDLSPIELHSWLQQELNLAKDRNPHDPKIFYVHKSNHPKFQSTSQYNQEDVGKFRT